MILLYFRRNHSTTFSAVVGNNMKKYLSENELKKIMKLIKGVTSFHLSDSELVHSEGNLVFFDSKEDIILNEDCHISEVNLTDGILFIWCTSGDTYLKKNKRLIQIPNSLHKSVSNLKSCVYSNYNFETFEYDTNVYDFKLEEQLLDLNLKGNIVILDNNTFVNINGKKNTIKLLQDNKIAWHYQVSTPSKFKDIFGAEKDAEISQVVGIYNDLIWIYLNIYELQAISIKSGKLIHRIEKIFKGTGDIHLDSEKGVMKILVEHRYFEFDLVTLKITELTIDKSYFIRSCNFYSQDDNLYFCGIFNYPQEHKPNSFGIFNTVEKKITWLEKPNEKWGEFYNPPQANKFNLAILDDKNNLIILNRK